MFTRRQTPAQTRLEEMIRRSSKPADPTDDPEVAKYHRLIGYVDQHKDPDLRQQQAANDAIWGKHTR